MNSAMGRRVVEKWVSPQADRGTAGSASVELALIVPILVLLMLGLLDLGRVFYAAITVTSAARAGVGYGSMTPVHSTNQPMMIAAAQADARDVSGFTFAASRSCECYTVNPVAVACNASGCPDGSQVRIYVEVTVSGSFTPTVAYPGLPSSIALTRVARMRAQ